MGFILYCSSILGKTEFIIIFDKEQGTTTSNGVGKQARITVMLITEVNLHALF